MIKYFEKLDKLSLYKTTLLLFLIAPIALATTFSSSNFKVLDSEIDSLSQYSTSTNFGIKGTIPYVSEGVLTYTSAVSTVMPVLSGTAGVSSADLSWTAATGVTGPSYEVGTATGSGGPYTYDTGQSGLTATKSGLSVVHTYFFVIRVKDSGDTIQGTSNEVSVAPVTFLGAQGGGGRAPVVADAIQPTVIHQIIESVQAVITPIISFFQPKPKQTQGPFEIPLEQLVPQLPQLSFSGLWNLIPREPVRELVLRPLPKNIQQLAGSFPELGKLFSEVGIDKFNDLQKLRNINLSIPGLSDTLALPGIRLSGKRPQPIKNLKVAQLSSDLRSRFPKGILFASLAKGAIDVKPSFSINREGESEEVIKVITGKTLSLSIRPAFPANSVKGYLLFKARKPNRQVSLINKIFAIKTAKAQKTETALVLQEFEYFDSDNDGIYIAEIKTPAVAGSYEIVTVVNYVDEDRGTRALRLLTVIDPEGYIYEKSGGKELRIPGAIVTLEWLNPDTATYEQWPAAEYSQQNPQVTEVTGQYSFLVPPGFYQLMVSTPGYNSYTGKPFQVSLESGVHNNIELKTRFWFLSLLDWKTALLVIIALLLLYNFYRDKIRLKGK